VEFGAKVTAGLMGGYTFLDKSDWDNFESKILHRRRVSQWDFTANMERRLQFRFAPLTGRWIPI